MQARLLLALISVLVVAASATRPASAEKICAFAMPTQMVSKLYSGTAKAGQDFEFRVAQPITLDDGTSIPAGTVGYGVVRSASSAGRHNHDGMIAIEPRYIVVPKPKGGVKRVEVTMNPTLPVTWTPSEPLLNKAASHVPMPIPGLVMSGINMVRWGRNITLGPGFGFSVVPVGDLARGAVC